jgi:predicted enzyme related to lactoylglutathione lyase
MYTLRHLDGDEVCAIYDLDEERQEQGVLSHWLAYVSVESADATVSRTRELGGEVSVEPHESHAGARMAVVADPAGASLAVWQPGTWTGAGRVNDVGCMGWNELQTRDAEAAGDFYSGLFGWEIEPIKEDGRLVYTTIKNAGNQNGGFMPMTEQHGDAPSFWLPYFTVSSRDAAMEKARGLGGTVLAGPLDLPSGKIAVLGDPQGAAFAVFEGETDE